MKKYRRNKAKALSLDGVSLKKRILRTRRRAKLVGTLYLLGIIALAAAACLPLMIHDLAPVGVMAFWKSFLPANMDMKSVDGLTKLATSGLYALMLLGVVINVFRALGKLGWLNKKNASRMYGFNRNVFAMEDLGRIFSGSLAVIMTTYFLIAILCPTYQVNLLMLITLGVGFVLHLLLGFWGAKTGYFDIDKDQILEQKRLAGRFAPIFRNFLQLAALVVMLYCFLEVNTLATLVDTSNLKNITKDMANLISIAAQAVILLCFFVLIKHATAITEYNIDGAQGAGMKNFRIFSFFVFLAAGAAVAYKYLMVEGKQLDTMMLIIAGVAFVMFVIELIMRKMPKLPSDKKQKKVKEVEEEFNLESLPQPEVAPQAPAVATAQA